MVDERETLTARACPTRGFWQSPGLTANYSANRQAVKELLENRLTPSA